MVAYGEPEVNGDNFGIIITLLTWFSGRKQDIKRLSNGMKERERARRNIFLASSKEFGQGES